MGGRSGKVRKLNPKTIKDLQACVDVDFTVDEIESWFREYRTSLGKGMDKLRVEEFQDVYNSVFEGDAKQFTKHLFRTFDTNGDGYVDFKEFIVGLCISGTENTDSRLRWAFRMYDFDSNGYVTREEMTEMLKAIYKMISYDVKQAEDDTQSIDSLIRDFFRKADNNNDNKISMDEFINGVTTMPIIINLLQCDPEPEMLEENVVSKFDDLDIKQKTHMAEGGKKVDDTKTQPHDQCRSQSYVAT